MGRKELTEAEVRQLRRAVGLPPEGPVPGLRTRELTLAQELKRKKKVSK